MNPNRPSSVFPELEAVPKKELFPGVTIQTVWQERMMMSFVRFVPGAVVPTHSHPHEQMGILLDGEFEFTIGSETKRMKKGDLWRIPGNVPHSVKAGERGAYALDVFSPPREEYKD